MRISIMLNQIENWAPALRSKRDDTEWSDLDRQRIIQAWELLRSVYSPPMAAPDDDPVVVCDCLPADVVQQLRALRLATIPISG